jgi:hypothetical protein
VKDRLGVVNVNNATVVKVATNLIVYPGLGSDKKLKLTIKFVNRGTPRRPRQHRVGDLGGTRRYPTAHDGSKTKYPAGNTSVSYLSRY